MVFDKAAFNCIIPLTYDFSLFARTIQFPKTEGDAEKEFGRCFSPLPIKRSFQLEGSPLLWDGDKTCVSRFVLTQAQRKKIGIHGNENHVYKLGKGKIRFQLNKIKLWFFKWGIAFLTIEITGNVKDESELLNLVSELCSVQMKRVISFEQSTGKNQSVTKSFTIMEVIDRIIHLQEYIPLKPYLRETYKKAHCLFFGIGNVEDERSENIFLEMLRLQRKSNMRTANGVSAANKYCPFDYITWAMSENVLAVVGDLTKGGADNQYFLADPGGLQKTVYENYLPVYLYCLAVLLCMKQLKEEYDLSSVTSAVECRPEVVRKLVVFRSIPIHELTSEPHINELFEEKLCRDTWKLQEQLQYKEELLQSVYELAVDIHGQIALVDERTARMEKQLDSLVHFVETDMREWISDQKSRLKVTEDELEDDCLVAGFIGKSSEYINFHIQEKDELVGKETDSLRLLFGKNWDKLLPTSRISLVSAGVLWKSCAGIVNNDFDFSGVCISATSALEAELKQIFFTGFQDYLSEKYGEPGSRNRKNIYEYWPEILLSLNKWSYEKAVKKGNRPQLKKAEIFTMGMMPYLLGKYDKKAGKGQDMLVRRRMEEYLRTIMLDQYQQNPLSVLYQQGNGMSFVEKCEQVRQDYRNPAAHASVVSRKQAHECYSRVIGKLEAFSYTSDVTGLIVTLYDYLK